MDTDVIVGTIGLSLGFVILVLSLIVLVIQIQQMKQFRTVQAYRMTLLVINLSAIVTVMAPMWGSMELLRYGIMSDIIRICSSLSVRLFFLIVVVSLFLMHTVFNKRRP